MKNKNLFTYGLRLTAYGWLAVSCLLLAVSSAEAIPNISNVELTSISDDRMVLTWSTTNEAASTEIIWGSGGLTNITTIAGTTKYHYVELTGLYQNTTYQYRIKSGNMIFPPVFPYYAPLSFKTLEKPSGEYLFSFAVLNDLRYAEGKASTKSARGIPYKFCAQIITSEVTDINEHGVAFTVLNGNIADDSVNYATEISTNLKGYLDALQGANENSNPNFDPNSPAYKYLPVPGYHDKKARYGGGDNWIGNSFDPLTRNPGSSEGRYKALYGYDSSSKDASSVFNYQFEYNSYNFIFLDSVSDEGSGGLANLDFLKDKISTSGKKTFVFMNFPAYNPLDSSTKDYPLDIPTAEVGGGIIMIDNHAPFRATLEAFKDTSGNPIVAAVISGHLGDNYKRDIPILNGISYVRQGPALAYPTGYSIYKVYSTGYVKTFYKTKGSSIEADGDRKPFYEYARDQISAETVSGQVIGTDILIQFWLGSSSNRNFTHQYAFIPGLLPRVISTGPTSNESAVNLNSPILITFNKRMSAASDLAEWVTIRDSSNNTLAVSSASFIDSSQLILKVTHPDFTIDKTYLVTVSGTKTKDEGGTGMGSAYVFPFNTFGGTKDDQPPTAYVNPLPNNSTIDPFPNFTGIATDSARVITVEYRFDNTGSWLSTEAVDGKFTGSVEVFQIKPPSPLSAGRHELWLKTSDGIGNTSTEGFSAYSFTIIVGEKPVTSSLKVNQNTIYSGDSISATPKIEVVITANNSLESGRITIGGIQAILVFVRVDNNYYATYEVGTVLPDGTYVITIEAFDVNSNALTYEASSLSVRTSADTSVQGVPLSYPNPFDPGRETTALSYSLSKDSNLTLTIHDLAGTLITKKTFTSNENGGRAGYNEVAWDGKSDAGQVVGNGIYIYLIIAEGKVVAKGKLTVYKR